MTPDRQVSHVAARTRSPSADRGGRCGRLAITRDVLGRPALVLSRSNRVLILRRILLGTAGSPLTWRRARPVEETAHARRSDGRTFRRSFQALPDR